MGILDKKCLFLISFIFFLICIPPSSKAEANVCVAPPHPENGNRQLNRKQCEIQERNCDVQNGTELPIGSMLIYSCNSGYRISGSSNVLCGLDGIWFNIPVCTEVRCKSLASESTKAECLFNDKLIDCPSSILPGTVAYVTCYNGYRKETFLFIKKKKTQCNERGQWEPEPFICVPECGVITTPLKPLVANGQIFNASLFPWHASLYKETNKDGFKKYICGATIINEKFLLTASQCIYDNYIEMKYNQIHDAYCVVDETFKGIFDPKKFYVAAGNIFRDYDSNLHDPILVKKTRVKKFYIGAALDEDSAYDEVILLEIDHPFKFSPWLLPACMADYYMDSELGLIAGFGYNKSFALSDFLLSAAIPYVPLEQCISSENKIRCKELKSKNKICAASTNGTSVWSGDIGSGLVLQYGNLWYLKGIVNDRFWSKTEGGLDTCVASSYSLLTKIDFFRFWVKEIILLVEESFSIPLCNVTNEAITTTNISATIETPLPSINIKFFPQITKPIVCTAPTRLSNGNRQLHWSQCETQGNCDVEEGVELSRGSYLVYTCNRGYKINGTRNVFCGPEGNWLYIPVCIEIHCKSLISESTLAECTLNNKWTSCESAILPGTKVKLSCRGGYNKESVFLSKQRDQITCNERGQWTPDPIRCIPACGHVEEFNSKPLITNGMNAEFFPWHASLYEVKRFNGPKEFICGATIIKENFLVTSAHCVFDETYDRVNDPSKYYIATGNLFRDYDFTKHDTRYVKKSRVKKIFVHCSYLGSRGNYAWDIALLEIEVPFIFTRWLLPACLDDTFVESGIGVLAGFGHIAPEEPSLRLQFATLPYVSRSQCINVNNSFIYEQLITSDKFCAGYLNGTSVCDGDSGGGLLFQAGDLWFLRGIVSSGVIFTKLGGSIICDTHSYSLYTRISSHFFWIQDIIYNLRSKELACIK